MRAIIIEESLKRLSQRIYFDTADWYWKDEGSGHLPAVRYALLTGTALKITTRVKGRTEPAVTIVKPYGVVWKAGEWHLVTAPIDESPTRYRLNLVDHVVLTDLRFSYPEGEEFRLQAWWAAEMEAHGQGDTCVVLRVESAAREELLRLTLKSTSEVEHTEDGGLVIRLYVDRWEWLIPLVTSYGGDVLVEKPQELRNAIAGHLRRALDAYENVAKLDFDTAVPGFRNDDSRLRSTRGRTSTEWFMPEHRTLIHVDTLRLAVKQPFNFRYTLWKPSHFATGLEQHSPNMSWRTFCVGELLTGVVMAMEDADTLRAEVYADGAWQQADRDRLTARLIHSYGLDEDISAFVARAEQVPPMRAPLAALAGMRQSCPENLFEIAIISLLLQNATLARTTQMMTNLLDHYGRVVEFDGVRLKAFFTPEEIAGVDEATFRERDRLGYRAKSIGRFAEFFAAYDPDVADHTDKAELMAEFQTIKGVGPYTATIIASHAVRDPSALGLDVWNRKLLAKRFLGVDDAEATVVMAEMTGLFPGYEGLAGLYVIEDAYREQAVVELVE